MRVPFITCVLLLCLTTVASAQFRGFRSTSRRPTYQPTPTYPSPPVNNGAAPNSSRAWYQSFAVESEHDFGIVARASTQEHLFEFVNTTGSDLALVNVKASCGCTKPKILTSLVKPGETARINAVFDTMNFYGSRSATLTVSMKKSDGSSYGSYGELQLSVKGEIRRDVVLSPGSLDFQNIPQAESAQQSVKVLYAGNPNWKILDVKSTNPNLTATAREVERDSASGRVTYALDVKLAGDQPTGPFTEFLTIQTNDPKTTGMPVQVGGMVKSMIDVSPIELGIVNQGQSVSKQVVVRSDRDITIESVLTNHPGISFQPSEGSKKLHILTYTLDTSKPIEINQEITIVANDGISRPTKVSFSVQVVPATVSSNPK